MEMAERQRGDSSSFGDDDSSSSGDESEPREQLSQLFEESDSDQSGSFEVNTD